MSSAYKNLAETNSFLIDPGVIAFDIDGVVADTISLFIDIAREDFNVHNLKYEDITTYSLENVGKVDQEVANIIIEKLLKGDYRQPLKSFEGASSVLRRIGERAGPVLFVTARPYSGPVDEWIVNNLGMDAQDLNIVATGSFEAKIDILLDRNISYFVEDRLETCFLLKDAGITPILFKQPWNRENQTFLEVSTWRELEALIAV